MANLDVSDVLIDPDFMSRGLTCSRTAVVVGDNGRSQKTVTSHTFSGVVTTNNGLNMDRRDDGTLIKGAINIHTQFALSAGNVDTGIRYSFDSYNFKFYSVYFWKLFTWTWYSYGLPNTTS